MKYAQAVRKLWRHGERTIADRRTRLLECVRYATLAPSSHNTQCWRFHVGTDVISIRPDFSRRCPVVDPDDHHLYVSLGCAAENLVQAARAHGMAGRVTVDASAGGAVTIALEPSATSVSALFEAIPYRQCTRAGYDGRPLQAEEIRRLETAGSGDGVRVLMLTGRSALEMVLDCVVQGNTIQMQDPAFVSELKSWLRFTDGEAIARGDGLSNRTSGNPPLPRWLASPLFRFLFRIRSENDRYARQVRSSAGIAVFVAERDDMSHRIEAGRCYERFALQATALGIRNAFVNQPVEAAGLRPRFASALDLGAGRPDLVVRFGRGPEMPRSLRRPVRAVLV
jgi:hypothetical protein